MKLVGLHHDPPTTPTPSHYRFIANTNVSPTWEEDSKGKDRKHAKEEQTKFLFHPTLICVSPWKGTATGNIDVSFKNLPKQNSSM
jgi:hypothetical protein